MFAVGRFGNVVSDDSFLSVACFSFLSNILSICIATKRKNIGAGLRGCTTPFLGIIPHPFPLSCICSTLSETRQKACGLVVSFRSLSGLTSCRPYANPLSLTEVNLTGRGTKSVILNSFQDLSFPQSIPHPTLSYLGEGIQVYPKADL